MDISSDLTMPFRAPPVREGSLATRPIQAEISKAPLADARGTEALWSRART